LGSTEGFSEAAIIEHKYFPMESLDVEELPHAGGEE
jgi:hypothetical protein